MTLEQKLRNNEPIRWREAIAWAIDRLLDTSCPPAEKQQRDQQAITVIMGLVRQVEVQAAAARRLLDEAPTEPGDRERLQ